MPTSGREGATESGAERSVGSHVTRNFAFSLLRLGIGQVLGLVTIVVMTHQLTPSGYALFGAIAAAGPALFVMLTGSLGVVLVRQPHAVSREQLSASMSISVIALGGAALLSVLTGVLLDSTLIGVSFGAYLLLISPCLPAWVYRHHLLRSASVAFMDLADRAGYQIGAVVLAVAVTTSAVGVVTGAVIVSGVSACIVALLLLDGAPRLGSPRAIGVPIHDVGAALLLTVGSVGLEATLIPLVSVLATTVQAGYFAWSMSIMVVPMGFAMMAFQVLLPGFSRADAAAVGGAVGQASRLVLALGMVLSTIMIAGLPSMLTWLFPARWDDALPTLFMLGAATVVYAATLPLVAAWTARGSISALARTQLASTAAGLTAAGVLAVQFGAVGAATGLLVGRTVLWAAAHRSTGRMGYARAATLSVPLGAVLTPLGGVAAAWAASAVIDVGVLETVVAVAIAIPLGVLLTSAAIGPKVVSDIRTAWGLLTHRA
jgi:O-antigen/teichoic acid export membrane protein